MSITVRKSLLALATAVAVGLSPLAISHFDDKEMSQSYRQSWFAMVGMNFGPMVSMLKGEMPWNDQQLQAFADQLATLTSMDVKRGFGPGSDKGTTRAKPEIWENKADFESKMQDLTDAAKALQSAAATGDKKAIAGQIAATGKTCKACHDEYKSKDYLY